MKNFPDRWSARLVGVTFAVITMALVGCERKSEPSAAAAPAPAYTAAPPSAPVADAASNQPATLKVAVSLTPAMAKKAAPTDSVYIFARAVDGPRMPVAIVRKQVKDLPATVVLDDSSSMTSDWKLSKAGEVIVTARVSKSGDAMPKPGDLEGVSQPVKAGGGEVSVSIANTVNAK